jgi:hypothetical protein
LEKIEEIKKENGGQGTSKIIASVNVQKGDLDVADWTTI